MGEQRDAEKKQIEQEAQTLKEERKLRIQELEAEKKELTERRMNYRIELNGHRIQRAQRENELKQAEIDLEHEILNEASRALDDEATFTAELRDQRIKYENEYRDYIAQQRKEEDVDGFRASESERLASISRRNRSFQADL